jgi:hypothetical protein
MDNENPIKIVATINKDMLYEASEANPEVKHLFESNPPLVLRSSGESHVIAFLDIPIWDSEEDERPYLDMEDDANEERIPLTIWLNNEIDKILITLSDYQNYRMTELK